MHVNGVTPPVVYIPTQVIAPSVPNDHPISLPTADKNADPTPSGTPFVASDAPKDHSASTGKESAAAKSAMVEPPTSRPKIVTPPVETPDKAREPARLRGFDEYA